MSAPVSFNLLIELVKEIKCEHCRAFYRFFATRLIISIIQGTYVRFYLSYDFINYLKSYFWRDNVRILPYA